MDPKYRNAQKERYRKVVRDAKSKPCADCGNSYPSYVMDFDHRDGEEKLFNIGMMVSTRPSMEAFLAEIAKCDVVCSNCHRIRTWNRRQSSALIV